MTQPTPDILTTFEATYGRLVSVAMPVPSVDLLAFLASAEGQPRCYWEHAAEPIAFAGVGAALDLTAWGADRWQQMQAYAQAVFHHAHIDTPDPAAGPRLFGGLAFSDDFLPDITWADFAPAQLLLPHYQLTRHGDQCYLTINAHLAPDDDLDALRAALAESLRIKAATLADLTAPMPAPHAPNRVAYPTSFEGWQRMIDAATGRIRAGELAKVVLARVAELRFASPVEVLRPLAWLRAAYPHTYRFLFEPRPRVAFYGATPELLVEVQGRQFRTMGLAGSARRGRTPEEDAALAAELLHDPKNCHEHQIVVERIAATLRPLVSELTVGEMGVLALSNIQHLYTPMHGTFPQPMGLLTVAEHLHPTPALGGEPRDAALALISALEAAPRGWFGAPVGWVDASGGGQLAVAIRSAIAQQRRVWLYAGCGIVADSDPLKEWGETALKFRPMLHALGVQQEALHG
ncbi:isochorismate synthase [Fischerella thermalis CCMEE 5330]|uniref:isochorismate synthase n=1 Tax=Fischerella thermalis CCMEE 5330 TaxID=2019670 RepID=A0A2N6MNT9_9CYAN|nr:isochorismate synthase [Fischerella thermalis CCMEE 5330]